MLRCLLCATSVGLTALVLPLWPLDRAPRNPHQTGLTSRRGLQIFTSACAGCHGLDAKGGERAPNLAAGAVQQLPDREIFRIVKNGIPGTAMPAFHSLGDGELHALVKYLRALQGGGPAMAVPGNPSRGKALFFGAAQCSTCHSAEGKGGFIARDLSDYGSRRSPEEILRRIQAPESDEPGGNKVATVITHDGRKYSGVVRNEDNFSLQLQSLDGDFHLFTKSDVQQVEYGTQPLMPTNYGVVLSREQLDDIVSYLIHMRNRR